MLNIIKYILFIVFQISVSAIFERYLMKSCLHRNNILCLSFFRYLYLVCCCLLLNERERKWKSFSRVRLCEPMDSTAHGILQARILKWVASLFSRGSSQTRDWTHVSRIAGEFFTSWATRKPKILEWVAYPFSSGSSPPRNHTQVSCIAGGFFTNWAIREVLLLRRYLYYVSSIYCFLFFHWWDLDTF